MQLEDLLDIDFLSVMLEERFVRFQTHNEFPELRIYNYTEHCAYERAWNDVTLKTRGLIVNHDTGEVLARPFDKFFNYGEPSAPVLHLDECVEVTDKMDGSLGIRYVLPNGVPMIATRGSFHSDQAIHASQLLYDYLCDFDNDLTYLFEIIYPQNRIVLNYGDRDELVLIGARGIEYGIEYLPMELPEWSGARAVTYPYKTLRETLEAPPRVNAEGYVIFSAEQGTRVKLKQEDYVALHKIVTGLTKRRVWENLSAGKSLEDLLEIIPDEWHEWLRDTVEEITNSYTDQYLKVGTTYIRIMDTLGGDTSSRKAFATEAVKYPFAGLLFAILDSKNIEQDVWKMVRPSAEL